MFNVIRSFLNFETPLDKVIEVKADVYSSREIYYREDGMFLYAPGQNKREKTYFEIVLQRPFHESLNVVFSLYRSSRKDEAELRFVTLKDKVPHFVEAYKEMCHVAGLQQICDEFLEHPTWSVAHLAAYLGVSDFENPLMVEHLNSTDSNGMIPLHVAVSSSNIKSVEALVKLQCSLDTVDNNSNSVFHYASSTSKDIITTLSKVSTRSLNARNKNGHTPLHMACLADKPDCVKSLLQAGADVNISCATASLVAEGPPGYVGDFIQDNPNKLYQQDMKFGGTPLHWSCSRQVIEILIQKNCNVNALNFDGRTALHIMVMRNRLDCVVALLSYQADTNIGDADGNTPLHLAVIEANESIIQSLIIFGANLDALNHVGATPRHLIKAENEPKILYYLHAVGAGRCVSDMIGCTDGCKYDKSYAGIPPPPTPGPQNRDVLNQMLAVAGMEVCAEKHKNQSLTYTGGRLLCVDGGGIRGLILIQMLLELEKIVQRPLVDCFDWVAGTSTGGILALGLALRKTLMEILCLYFRMKEHTFIGSRPYPSEALENILIECFGSETVMADIKHPKIMITGVLADRKPVDLHLFRNYESPSNILGVVHDGPYEMPDPPETQLVWQVGRATGAAPSYFRAFGRFLDGGLIANNPTLDAITEIHEYNLALRAKCRDTEICPLKVVVSFGTGIIPVTHLTEIDVFRPESIWQSMKLVTGISAIGTLLVDQATASDGRVVDRARAWCSMIGVPYYRFTPQMSEDIVMDEKSDEKLVRMLWESKVYMYEHVDLMRELAVLLNN